MDMFHMMNYYTVISNDVAYILLFGTIQLHMENMGMTNVKNGL